MLSIKTMVIMYATYKVAYTLKDVYNTVAYIVNVFVSKKGFESEYYDIEANEDIRQRLQRLKFIDTTERPSPMEPLGPIEPLGPLVEDTVYTYNYID